MHWRKGRCCNVRTPYARIVLAQCSEAHDWVLHEAWHFITSEAQRRRSWYMTNEKLKSYGRTHLTMSVDVNAISIDVTTHLIANAKTCMQLCSSLAHRTTHAAASSSAAVVFARGFDSAKHRRNLKGYFLSLKSRIHVAHTQLPNLPSNGWKVAQN